MSRIRKLPDPVSSETSDLYGISDLFLFVVDFASQSKKKVDVYFFDVCCVSKSFWLEFRYPQQATVRF